MKRTLMLAVVAAISLAGGAGCSTMGNCESGCQTCGDTHPDMRALRQHMEGGGDTGPSTAAITYPYYTHKGPRDFLEPNPPSIGR